MAKSNKPIFWSLFAAGGTLAAFLAPVLAFLFVRVALGQPQGGLDFQHVQAIASHRLGQLVLFGVISLFLWHAAHRLRVTLHDLGLRHDLAAAIVLYLGAAAGCLTAAVSLLRIH